MNPKFIAIGGLAVILWAVMNSRFYERRKRRVFLSTRPSLTDEEIYAEFYSDTKIGFEQFCIAWHMIVEILHVECGRLRPTDPLEDLACNISWVKNSGDIDDLEYELSVLAVRRKVPRGSKLKVVNTIDDVILIMVSTDSQE